MREDNHGQLTMPQSQNLTIKRPKRSPIKKKSSVSLRRVSNGYKHHEKQGDSSSRSKQNNSNNLLSTEDIRSLSKSGASKIMQVHIDDCHSQEISIPDQKHSVRKKDLFNVDDHFTDLSSTDEEKKVKHDLKTDIPNNSAGQMSSYKIC